jgi:PAS domain-containing protein
MNTTREKKDVSLYLSSFFLTTFFYGYSRPLKIANNIPANRTYFQYPFVRHRGSNRYFQVILNACENDFAPAFQRLTRCLTEVYFIYTLHSKSSVLSFLHLIISNMSDVAAVLSEQHEFLYCNHDFEELMGIAGQKFPG